MVASESSSDANLLQCIQSHSFISIAQPPLNLIMNQLQQRLSTTQPALTHTLTLTPSHTHDPPHLSMLADSQSLGRSLPDL